MCKLVRPLHCQFSNTLICYCQVNTQRSFHCCCSRERQTGCFFCLKCLLGGCSNILFEQTVLFVEFPCYALQTVACCKLAQYLCLLCRYPAVSLSRSLARSLDCSLARSLARSLASACSLASRLASLPLLERSLARSHASPRLASPRSLARS